MNTEEKLKLIVESQKMIKLHNIEQGLLQDKIHILEQRIVKLSKGIDLPAKEINLGIFMCETPPCSCCCNPKPKKPKPKKPKPKSKKK